MSVDAAEIANARPVHRLSDDTIWDEAAGLRDACQEAIKQALAAAGIDALVTRSPHGTYPTWVRVEAWLPQTMAKDAPADPRLRTILELRFEVKPYREHSVTTSALAQIGRRTIAVADHPNFTPKHAAEWALYVVGQGPKPRQARFSDFISNACLSLVPFARTAYTNRILRAYRDRGPLKLQFLFYIIALILVTVGFNFQDDFTDGLTWEAAGFFSLAAVALVVGVTIQRRRKVIVSVIDRPTIPPRYLLRLDSWHAVIPELGPLADEVKRRIVNKLAIFASSGIISETERYGFRSPNGYDERDRLVITKGQGVAHLHIYRFGADIFVSWDSYINWAQWSETRPVSARAAFGQITEYRGLEPGLYVPNEYDLIDLNSLIEVMHRCVSDVLKAMMEEHRIDREVDFSIIRGDRDTIIDRNRYDQRRKQRGDGGADAGRRRWRVT